MTIINMAAIQAGAPYTDAISWSGAASSAAPLASGARVRAQMRVAPGSNILLSLDTQNGTLVATTSTTLQIVLTAAQTALLSPAAGGSVLIDFRRYDWLDADNAPWMLPFQLKLFVVPIITVF